MHPLIGSLDCIVKIEPEREIKGIKLSKWLGVKARVDIIMQTTHHPVNQVYLSIHPPHPLSHAPPIDMFMLPLLGWIGLNWRDAPRSNKNHPAPHPSEWNYYEFLSVLLLLHVVITFPQRQSVKSAPHPIHRSLCLFRAAQSARCSLGEKSLK